MKLADAVEPHSSAAGLDRLISQINGLNENAAVARIVRDLELLIEGHELPVFVDAGGFFDQAGGCQPPVTRFSVQCWEILRFTCFAFLTKTHRQVDFLWYG